MSALMGLNIPFIFTHDSIGVGEDGPTHQPVEQLAGLRAMPGLIVFRPADAKETAAGWYTALKSDKPVALELTRQDLPLYENSGKARRSFAQKSRVMRYAEALFVGLNAHVGLHYGSTHEVFPVVCFITGMEAA